jgi:hypothetical protein
MLIHRFARASCGDVVVIDPYVPEFDLFIDEEIR